MKIKEYLDTLDSSDIQYIELNSCATKGPKSSYGTKVVSSMPEGENICFTSGNKEFYIDSYMVDGEYLYINDGGVAGTKYYYGKASYTDHVLCLSIDETIETKYVYYYLDEINDYIYDKLFKGAGLKNLNKREFMKLKIPVPPHDIQLEIIHFLDKYSELSNRLLFELENELEKRKHQFEYYKSLILANNVLEEPIELQNICEIIDCPHTSPKWRDSGIPVIRNYNLVNGKIDTSNLSYVDEADYIERTKRVVPSENDILFSREAPIGNVGIIPKDFKCCQGQRVVLLRANTDIILPKYLMYALQGDFVKHQIKSVEGKGVTVSNFNISDLKKLTLQVPSIIDQQKAITELDQLYNLFYLLFDALSSEHELRKKQYHYYQSKLFNFNI